MGDRLICKQINMLCTIRKTTFPRKGRLIVGLLSCLKVNSHWNTLLCYLSPLVAYQQLYPHPTLCSLCFICGSLPVPNMFLVSYLSYSQGTNLKWKLFPLSNLFQIPLTKSVYVARAFTLSPSSPSWLQGTELLLLGLLTGKVILGHESWGQG